MRQPSGLGVLSCAGTLVAKANQLTGVMTEKYQSSLEAREPCGKKKKKNYKR